MKLQGSTFSKIITSAVLLGSASLGSAAVIAWDTPATISSVTDVSTEGTGLQAFNLGDSATPVVLNGVTFAAGTNPTGTSLTMGSGEGSLTLTHDQGANGWSQSDSFGSGVNPSPFASLDGQYQLLVRSANYVYTGASPALTATINSLNIGQEYLLQFWLNDSRDLGGADRHQLFSPATSAPVDTNTTNAPGGVGQFITGTFIADSTAQVISITSDYDSAGLNGYQIRAVPEPSALALAGLGILLVANRRSTRRSRLS